MNQRPRSRLSLLFELFATAQAAGALVAEAMDGSPLTPDEYAVYSVLFDEGSHAPTELARRCGMPPTSMSHFVRRAVERGHVERSGAPGDRRSYRIVLTRDGMAAHAAASRHFAEADRRFVGALAADEEDARATLRAIGRAAEAARDRLRHDTVGRTA